MDKKLPPSPVTPNYHRDPSFLLIYPPQHFRSEDSAKPDGSLSLVYLAGTLRQYRYQVDILDACTGNDKYTLEEIFYRTEVLPNGFIRIGMSLGQIAEEIRPYDVIGVTSIFTQQTSRVIEIVKFIKQIDPSKLVILGGVNARYLATRFFAAGADIICLSEAESTILQIGDVLRRGLSDFSEIPGIAFTKNGQIFSNPMGVIDKNLDKLAIPAWDLLPLRRYWEIARPHGGGFKPEDQIRYASMMTSRGCPFKCKFCHISKELEGSPSGNIGQLRLKSIDRVLQEIDILKDLGVQYIFIEDDSFLVKKKRAMRILAEIAKRQLTLSNVNGVNVMHLFKSVNGKLEVDRDLLEAMANAGFRELSLPFEAGSQRILDKYHTSKLHLDKIDTIALIRAAKEYGLVIGGNYTFGYPDETYDELTATIMLADMHMKEGMDFANLYCVQPYPGTILYDWAIAGGYLSPDFDPDQMNWMYPSMINTKIPPEVFRYVSKICWLLLNKPSRIRSVSSTGPVDAGKVEEKEIGRS